MQAVFFMLQRKMNGDRSIQEYKNKYIRKEIQI